MRILIEQNKMNKPFSIDQQMLLLFRQCLCQLKFQMKKVKHQTFLAEQFSKAEPESKTQGVTYYYLLIITINTNLLKLYNTLSISQPFQINYLISFPPLIIFELLICANHCSRHEWGMKHCVESLYQVRQKNSYHLLIDYSL